MQMFLNHFFNFYIKNIFVYLIFEKIHAVADVHVITFCGEFLFPNSLFYIKQIQAFINYNFFFSYQSVVLLFVGLGA